MWKWPWSKPEDRTPLQPELLQLYIDESGTGRESPVTVVFGVLFGSSVAAAYAAIDQAVSDFMPSELRSSYTPLHAYTMMQADEHSTTWPLADRWNLVRAIAAIPDVLGLVSFSAFVRRENPFYPTLPGETKEDFHYAYAFTLCVSQADAFVTKFFGEDVHFMVRSEDMDHTRRKRLVTNRVRELKHGHIPLPDVETRQPRGEIRRTVETLTRRTIAETERKLPDDRASTGWRLTAKRVLGDVQFIPNTEPLLSIADAGGYCVRRYLTGAARAEELLETIGGDPTRLREYGIAGVKFGTMMHRKIRVA